MVSFDHELIDLKQLFDCARNGDVAYYEKLLRNKDLLSGEIAHWINKVDSHDQYTPLIVASKNDHAKIVDILCELGADVNYQGGWNKSTALIKAAEKGSVEVTEVLIKRHANVNLYNTFKSTALMLASERGFDAIVRILLQNNVNKQLFNQDGYTALILAAEMGCLECVKLLLQEPEDIINIDVSNKFGKNALMMAAENGHKEVVEYLGSKGANVEAESKRGATAIILAAMKGHIDVVEHLSLRANIYKRNNNGENAVSTAVQNGFVEIVKHLLNISDRSYTPFQVNNCLCTGITLADESDPNTGNTLIMIACANGKVKVLKYLVEIYQEASVNLDLEFLRKNRNDQNAFTLACQGGHLRVLSELLRLSAPERRNKITNDDNILSMLKKFYLAQPEKFKIFCKVASLDARQYYLFELLVDILPAFPSPISVLADCHQILLTGLKKQRGSYSDRYLISSLISYAVALKKCSTDTKHANESKKLNDLLNIVEQILVRCMTTAKMTKLENVLLAVSGKSYSESSENNIHNFAQYRSIVFSKGPLVAYIRYELTSLLETAQVSTLMDVTFIKSINPRKLENIHNEADFYVLRTNCNSVRRTPAAIFFIEGTLKLLTLVLLGFIVTCIYSKYEGLCTMKNIDYHNVTSNTFILQSSNNSYVNVSCILSVNNTNFEDSGNDKSELFKNCLSQHCKANTNNFYENITVVFVISRLINIIGECYGENELFKLKHLDQWNAFDVSSLILMTMWAMFKLPIVSNALDFDFIFEALHRLLAMAIISIFLSLLKFTLLHQQLSQLTIMIFRVIRDLKWISILFVLSIFVFSVPFHSLFPKRSFNETFINLLYASLGNLDIDKFDDVIGQILFYVFIILQNVVLFNLVLARLSSSHEEMEKKSWGERALLRAHVLREYLVYVDRNPLCMLPPPLNLVPATYYLYLRFIHNEKYKVSKESAGRLSDVCLSILTSFFYTVEECDRCISTMEYEGRDNIIYKTSYYSYMKLYIYYLFKICKEAFDTKIYIPSDDCPDFDAINSNAVNPLIRSSSLAIGDENGRMSNVHNPVFIRNSSVVSNGYMNNLNDMQPNELNRMMTNSVRNVSRSYSDTSNSMPFLRYPAPDSNFDMRRQPTINSDFGMLRMTSESTIHSDSSDNDNIYDVLFINIIRISNLTRDCRLYNAKLRLFVRINFNNQVYTSKTTLNKGKGDREVQFHDTAEFEVSKLKVYDIIFEVYDSYQGVFPDRLIGTYRGKIKEWIANGRFEDSLPITEEKVINGKVEHNEVGKLQINARMKFLSAEEMKKLAAKTKQKNQELFSEEDRIKIFDVPTKISL